MEKLINEKGNIIKQVSIEEVISINNKIKELVKEIFKEYSYTYYTKEELIIIDGNNSIGEKISHVEYKTNILEIFIEGDVLDNIDIYKLISKDLIEIIAINNKTLNIYHKRNIIISCEQEKHTKKWNVIIKKSYDDILNNN